MVLRGCWRLSRKRQVMTIRIGHETASEQIVGTSWCRRPTVPPPSTAIVDELSRTIANVATVALYTGDVRCSMNAHLLRVCGPNLREAAQRRGIGESSTWHWLLQAARRREQERQRHWTSNAPTASWRAHPGVNPDEAARRRIPRNQRRLRGCSSDPDKRHRRPGRGSRWKSAAAGAMGSVASGSLGFVQAFFGGGFGGGAASRGRSAGSAGFGFYTTIRLDLEERRCATGVTKAGHRRYRGVIATGRARAPTAIRFRVPCDTCGGRGDYRFVQRRCWVRC